MEYNTVLFNSIKKVNTSHRKSYFIISLFILFNFQINSQEKAVLTFEEYTNYVKKFHPIAKQAQLKLKQAKAELQKSRGNFDPKIESEFARKDFKKTDYYNILDAKLKIPTWFGVELKAGFEKNSGVFLNPERDVPDNGLYSAGASIDIFGIWINKRVATLKKAKVLAKQRNIEYQLLLNEIIFEASNTYFAWKNAYDNKRMYSNFITVTDTRLNGIKLAVTVGDKAPIDSIEAKIALQNRKIAFKQAEIDYQKARLEMESYLWTEEEYPLEIQENIQPQEIITKNTIDTVFKLPKNNQELQALINNHPKITLLNQKIESLSIERRLKIRELFPKLKIDYNFISPQVNQIDTFNSNEFKTGFTFSYPLFLRKERAALKLNNIKHESLNLKTKSKQLKISNKLKALWNSINIYTEQLSILNNAIKNYQILLKAEERKFSVGESSLFLINSREQKLIDIQLKKNTVSLKLNNTKAKLYNSLGIN